MEDKTNSKNRLQESYLDNLIEEQVQVSVFMVNGIKLDGKILSYDNFTILLGSSVDQLILKQKISTIGPSSGLPRKTHNAKEHKDSREHRERPKRPARDDHRH